MEIREVKKQQSDKPKKSRRGKKAALVGIITVLLLLIVVGILCFTVLFPIANITVSGNSLYSPEQIINASGVKAGDKLFSVFSETVNSRITKALPYVKNVKLEKHFPNSINIKVAETPEKFYFSSENIYFVADSDYKILKQSAELPENLTYIKIPDNLQFKIGESLDSENKSLSLVSSTYKSLESLGQSINEISISAYDTVTVKLAERFEVMLGVNENFEGKISHLKSMISEIDKKNGSNVKGKIDLSSWSLQKREGYFEITNVK